jgi:hypothetical protein
MRLAMRFLLCCALASGLAMARGGAGGGGARGGGGGFRGGGFAGGGFRGGYGGGYYGGGYRGGYYGYRGFYGGYYGPYWGWGGWPYYWGLGLGAGYWPGYSYPYYDPYYYSSPYAGYYGGYAGYQTSPNVTVVYPPDQGYGYPAPNASRAVIREYDQYGQEVRPATGAASTESPIYLIAFNDHVIRAAAAYWVDGKTLHFVTLEHEERQAPIDSVDRTLSLKLNFDRRVPFQLPAQ